MNSNFEHPFRAGTVPSPPAAGESDSADVTLVTLYIAMLRRRRRVVGLALAALVIAAVTSLMSPRRYASTGAFLPQSGRSNPGLGGVASQLGISLPSSDGFQSPQFYADLLVSRPLLASTVDARYPVEPGSKNAKPLVDVLGPQPPDATPQARESAIDALRKAVNVSVSLKTGVVTYFVVTRSPLLSQQIASRMLDFVNEFNRVNKQSQAGAERRFTEGRLSVVGDSLRAQEDRLLTFLKSNRDFGNSSSLRFQEDRLTQSLESIRQLHARLTLAFEQARIDEVRDTPVITVVQSPEVPVRPESRGLAIRLILGFVLGSALGVMWAVIPEFLKGSQHAAAGETEELAALQRDALGDLRRPWRLLRKPSLSGKKNTGERMSHDT